VIGTAVLFNATSEIGVAIPLPAVSSFEQDFQARIHAARAARKV
jgi:hypothetical protein